MSILRGPIVALASASEAAGRAAAQDSTAPAIAAEPSTQEAAVSDWCIQVLKPLKTLGDLLQLVQVFKQNLAAQWDASASELLPVAAAAGGAAAAAAPPAHSQAVVPAAASLSRHRPPHSVA